MVQLTHTVPSTAVLAATCCHFPGSPRHGAVLPTLPCCSLDQLPEGSPLQGEGKQWENRATHRPRLLLDSWPAKATSPTY